MIRAKIALQALWKRGISWDEELPPELSERWKRLFHEMVQLNGVRFDRCLTPPNAIGQPVQCVFSDASEEAFGACAYVRWQLSTGDFNAQTSSMWLPSHTKTNKHFQNIKQKMTHSDSASRPWLNKVR